MPKNILEAAGIKTNLRNNVIFAVNSLLLAWITVNLHFNIEAVEEVRPLFTVGRSLLFAAVLIFVFTALSFLQNIKESKAARFTIKIATHPLLILMLAVVCFRVWYIPNFRSYVLYFDTGSYVQYPFNIFQLQTDMFRTPVYPYFLNIISLISRQPKGSSGFYLAVSIVQQLLSLISVPILYFALRMFYKTKYLPLVVAGIYGISPAVISWDLCILTESLSLFFMVLLIYFIFSYLKNPTTFGACSISFFILFMIMLRPVFIYMLAILGVFFAARFILCKADRKRCIAGFLTLLVVGGMVAGYAGLNRRNHGYFAISSVGNTVNNLYIVMRQGMYNNPDYPEITIHLREHMENPLNDNWMVNTVVPLPTIFSYNEISSYVRSSIRRNRDAWNEYTRNKFRREFNTPIAVQYSPLNEENRDFENIDSMLLRVLFPFTILQTFLLSIFGVIFALLALIIKRRVCWQILGLSAIIFTHVFVSVYGSMAEFARLSVMVIPPVMILVVYIADYVISAVGARKLLYLCDSNSTEVEIK